MCSEKQNLNLFTFEISELDYVQDTIRLWVLYQQQSRKRRYYFSWWMPGRLWAIVSLLTQLSESIFYVLGRILVEQQKIIKLLHFCLFIKKCEAHFYVNISKLCSVSMLPQKHISLVCCPGQTQVLRRLCKNICLTLPCAICTDTFTLNPFPEQHNTQKKSRSTEHWHFCDLLHLLLAVERTMYLLQMS